MTRMAVLVATSNCVQLLRNEGSQLAEDLVLPHVVAMPWRRTTPASLAAQLALPVPLWSLACALWMLPCFQLASVFQPLAAQALQRSMRPNLVQELAIPLQLKSRTMLGNACR